MIRKPSSFHRHAAYLTAGELVFVFEGPEVEWNVNDLVDDPVIASFFTPWQKLIDGPPAPCARVLLLVAVRTNKLGVGLGV